MKLTRNRNHWIWLAVGLLIAQSPSLQTVLAAEKTKTGTIYLKNGDFVRGTFATTDDASMLNWDCTSFQAPIEFDLRGVDYVSFVGPPKKPVQPQVQRNVRANPLAVGLQNLFRAIPTPPPAPEKAANAKGSSQARVQMVNDNIVYGQLISMDEETIVIESKRHGRVALRREMVMEVDGVSESASLIFDGSTSLSGWESFGSNKQSLGYWAAAGDGLSTEFEGSAIYGKYQTLDRLVCEVELTGKKKPGFQVTLGANKLPRSLQSGFTLESWGSKVVIHRQVGGDLKHVELKLPKLKSSGWRVSLQLYVDLKKNTVIAYAGGEKVGELALPESAGRVPGAGIVVRNRGQDLKLSELRIRRWSGPVRNARPDLDMVVLNDGEWAEGSIKAYSPEEKKLAVEVDGEEKQFDLDQIDQLRFRRLAAIPPMPETDDVRVTYLDGSGVNGRYLKVQDGAVWVQSQISDEPIKLATAGMATARFASQDAPKINPRKTGLVEFYGCSFHGRVVNGETEQELEWESVYCKNPVKFSPGAMTRVSFEPSQHDLGLKRLFSELALVNGDRIPCDVEYIDNDQIVAIFAGGERAKIRGDHFKALRDSLEANCVYPGFQQGEQWLSWQQFGNDSYELTPNGTLHFFAPRILAREFKELPDLARISFDIRFDADSTFVIGYGANTPVHAVRPTNSYSYTQEALEKAAKQRPDTLIEFSVQKSGKTLSARGVSRVAGILGMVMGHRGAIGRVSPKTLNLDDNAVAHIDILIDRKGREFAIVGNGQELYRWREPGNLEGTFLHLGVSPDNSTPRSAGVDDPLFSIFNFRVTRWPGDMADEHRERFLTRRMGTRRKATTHVLRAANGDSLRGQLVRVEKDVVVFKSRLRTYRIERDKVVEIITLKLPGDEEDTDDSQGTDHGTSDVAGHEHSHDDHAHDDHSHDDRPHDHTSPASEAERLTRVRLWGGGTVSLQQVRADEAMVVGESPLVGPISVPWEAIAAIDFAGEPRPDRDFIKWVLRDPPPLPEAPAQSPSQSAESPWLNKPAPDFELDLNDGSRISLADFKGKPVVLDFWATWCGPCLASMPSIMEMAEEYGEDVQVIAVNMQEAPEDVEEFLTARLWKLTVGYDESGALGRTFNVTSIPCTMVIDGEGIVRHVHVGASPTLKQDLMNVIDELQKQAASGEASEN